MLTLNLTAKIKATQPHVLRTSADVTSLGKGAYAFDAVTLKKTNYHFG